ncbi:MAG: hypothetical protein WCA23_14210 [Stellaceae bacterium]
MLGNPAPDFLAGGSEMGALIRAADWTRTPLGPPESWPISLRTAVGIMLSSRYAMFVWWGRQLTNLYYDAYRPFLGEKHPTLWANRRRKSGRRSGTSLARAPRPLWSPQSPPSTRRFF